MGIRAPVVRKPPGTPPSSPGPAQLPGTSPSSPGPVQPPGTRPTTRDPVQPPGTSPSSPGPRPTFGRPSDPVCWPYHLFAGPDVGLLGLFTFACAVTPANINKASKPVLRPANRGRGGKTGGRDGKTGGGAGRGHATSSGQVSRRCDVKRRSLPSMGSVKDNSQASSRSGVVKSSMSTSEITG